MSNDARLYDIKSIMVNSSQLHIQLFFKPQLFLTAISFRKLSPLLVEKGLSSGTPTQHSSCKEGHANNHLSTS